jgi:pimeloyl-ACP methyl ester carboxylesterase
MVLLGGYAQGWAVRCRGEELARREAMTTLSRTGWGTDTPAFRQMFSNLYIPGGSAEQLAWWTELQRVSTSPANAERLQRALSTIDVKPLLARVTVPTLVAHARRDQVVPFACGEQLAAAIPGSRFVALDSENHVLLEGEPAWDDFQAAARRFLRPAAEAG